MGFDYELYEAPDRKFGSMSEVSSIEGLSSWMNNPQLLLERDDDKRPLFVTVRIQILDTLHLFVRCLFISI